MSELPQLVRLPLCKQTRLLIQQYIEEHPEEFDDLLNIILYESNKRIVQCAAWPLSHLVENDPKRLDGHWQEILESLSARETHDTSKRNIFRALTFVNIPSKHQGEFYELSLKITEENREATAIQAFAMTVGANIAAQYEELKNEYIEVLNQKMQISEKGLYTCSKNLIKKLSK